MNEKIKRILKHEAEEMGIPMPALRESAAFREGGYVPGTLFVPADLPFADVLFLSLHELCHHRQYLYVQTHEDSYAHLLESEMENYSKKPYSELYMEQEAFAYAYSKILDYYPDYIPPCRIGRMIENFLRKNKK